MPNLLKALAVAACALAVAGCAHDAVREDPHHYSKDARGNRIACYTTTVANEYECVPVRRYAYAEPYPYYDPFWSMGFYYGWPGYHDHVIYVQQPAPAPTPPPAPAAPPHWKKRR